MTSEAPFFQCRQCGLRYRSDKLIEHERYCAQQNKTETDERGKEHSSKNVSDTAILPSLNSSVNEVRDTSMFYDSKPDGNYERVETKTVSSRSKVKASGRPLGNSNNGEKIPENELFSQIKKGHQVQEGSSELCKEIRERRTVSPEGKETIERRTVSPDGTEVIETTTTTARTGSNDRNTSSDESRPFNGKSEVKSKKQSTRREYSKRSLQGQENNTAPNPNRGNMSQEITERRKISPDGKETIERRTISPDGTEVVETTTTTARTGSNDRNTSSDESWPFNGKSAVKSKKQSTRREYSRKSPHGQESNTAPNQSRGNTSQEITERRKISPDSKETVERRTVSPDGAEVVESKTTTTRTKSNDRNLSSDKSRSFNEPRIGKSKVQSKKQSTRKEYTSRRVHNNASQRDVESSSHQSDSKNSQDEEFTTLQKDKEGKGKESDPHPSNSKSNKSGGSSALQKDRRKESSKKENLDIGKEPYSTSEGSSSTLKSASSSKSSQDDFLNKLPELSLQDEVAYKKHKKSLIPCTHCERKFSPARVSVHERSCIKRPKEREYITPDKKMTD